MLHRLKSKRIFIMAIIVSFMAHFMLCLVLRGYKNERCPLSFAFHSGNYGLGAMHDKGSAAEVDDGRIQVQLVTRSTPVPPTNDSLTTPEPSALTTNTLSSESVEQSTPMLNDEKPLEATTTLVCTSESTTDSSLETLGKADTLAKKNQASSLVLTQTAPQQSLNKDTCANKNLKAVTQSIATNNYCNDNLNLSEKTGPGHVGGRTYQSASAVRNPYPPYPIAARREGLQGEVMVAIDVSETGRINNVEITRSSGHCILDQEVLKTIRKYWRFSPAHSKGKPVPSKEELVFRFVLD